MSSFSMTAATRRHESSASDLVRKAGRYCSRSQATRGSRAAEGGVAKVGNIDGAGRLYRTSPPSAICPSLWRDLSVKNPLSPPVRTWRRSRVRDQNVWDDGVVVPGRPCRYTASRT